MDVVKHQKTPHRWKKGETGNPNGRPRKPEIEELRDALNEAQKANNKSFLQHFVSRAFENDQVAIALAKKLIPDKSMSEVELTEYLNKDLEGMSVDELFKERDRIIKKISEVRPRDTVSEQDKSS